MQITDKMSLDELVRQRVEKAIAESEERIARTLQPERIAELEKRIRELEKRHDECMERIESFLSDRIGTINEYTGTVQLSLDKEEVDDCLREKRLKL